MSIPSCNSSHLIQLRTRTDAFKYSFYPRSIRLWKCNPPIYFSFVKQQKSQTDNVLSPPPTEFTYHPIYVSQHVQFVCLFLKPSLFTILCTPKRIMAPQLLTYPYIWMIMSKFSQVHIHIYSAVRLLNVANKMRHGLFVSRQS